MEVLKLKTPLESTEGLNPRDLSDTPVPEAELTRYKDLVRSLLVVEDTYAKSMLEKSEAKTLEKLEQQRILLTDKEMRAGDTLFSGARSISIEVDVDFVRTNAMFLGSRSLKPKRVRRFI